MKRTRWRVRYKIWNRRREVVRFFQTERLARVFYKRLTVRRRNFTVMMSIEQVQSSMEKNGRDRV